jgi:hypothetical protein
MIPVWIDLFFFLCTGEVCREIVELERDDNSGKRGILVTNRLPVHAGTWRYDQRVALELSLYKSLLWAVDQGSYRRSP